MSDESRRATGNSTPDRLSCWVDHVSTELGVDPDAVDVGVLLSMTKTVAHDVVRPAAPITCFIAGLAAAGGNPDALGETIDKILRAVESFPPEVD